MQDKSNPTENLRYPEKDNSKVDKRLSRKRIQTLTIIRPYPEKDNSKVDN